MTYSPGLIVVLVLVRNNYSILVLADTISFTKKVSCSNYNIKII